MLILISDAFDKSLPEKLSVYGTVTDDKSRLAEADVVLIRSKTKATKEYIDSAPNMKLIIRGGVGMDNIAMSEIVKPALTTVINDSAEFAEKAARLLFDRILYDYDGAAREAFCERKLVERDSVRRI